MDEELEEENKKVESQPSIKKKKVYKKKEKVLIDNSLIKNKIEELENSILELKNSNELTPVKERKNSNDDYRRQEL